MPDKEEIDLPKLKELGLKLKILLRPNDILGIAFWTLIIAYSMVIIYSIVAYFMWFSDECCGEFLSMLFCNIVSNTTEISIILMIMVFLYSVFKAAIELEKEKEEYKEKYKKDYPEGVLKYIKSKRLINILIISLSISAIPTGISLIISAFEPKLISYMTGVEIYIAFAGFSIISVAYLSYRNEEEDMSMGINNQDELIKLMKDMKKGGVI